MDLTMSKFDEIMESIIERAKETLDEEAILTPKHLFSTLVQNESFSGRYTTLDELFPAPEIKKAKAERIKPDPVVKKVFDRSKKEVGSISAEKVFELLLFHEVITNDLSAQDKISLQIVRDQYELDQYKASPARQLFLKHISRFGSFLTDEDLKHINLCGRDDLLPNISRSLMKMRKNDALLVGPSGVGKSAVIREFARRVKNGHDSIPPSLRGAEVFQISPENLTVGAVSRPQFTNRVEMLREHLEKHPKIILVINPMDALISKDSRRPDQLATEESIRMLVQSNVPVLATMSPSSHLLVDSRPDWENIFEVIRVPEPPSDQLIEVLRSQVPSFKRHYVGLGFTDDGLQATIDYSRRIHPTLCEPRRSVQFLDELCVRAQTSSPIIEEISRLSVEKLLNEPLSANAARISFNTDELYASLTEKIVGQDEIMQDLASMVTTRMSKWASTERPRGVFLFGGPTGVGKTESAVQLAQIISGSANNLIRVDCNTLQPTGQQKTSVIWTLLGVPPGYMGHGEGGLLSKVREKPNSVILFDEFEKADAAVGKLLLQILDTGVQRDNNGSMLDFRQSLIIFTSNLGCDYKEAPPQLGFSNSKQAAKKLPTVDEEQLRSELRLMGYGPEFLARIHRIFLFSSLTDEDIGKVIDILLESLKGLIEDQGYTLVPSKTFSNDVAVQYAPRDGVRGVINKVRGNFTRVISETEREGKLEGIRSIALHYGTEETKRDGDVLYLYITL
jgi:ATP-dependent Clp protease ATP-binding subunit ClpA